MNKLLWLDDYRNPFEGEWLEAFAPDYIGLELNVFWVKSYEEFVNWIKKNGLPNMIAFDHDLGGDIAVERVNKGMSKRQARKLKAEEKTGYDCAKWLVNHCLDKDLDFPEYVIQSANPAGKENIFMIIENYKKYRYQ